MNCHCCRPMAASLVAFCPRPRNIGDIRRRVPDAWQIAGARARTSEPADQKSIVIMISVKAAFSRS